MADEKTHRRRCQLVLVSMLFAACTANAKDIFVSPSGNDANSGASASAPLRTIARASSLVTAGDTVVLMAGRYQESIKPTKSGAAGKPITYRSEQPHKAVLTHSTAKGLNIAIEVDTLSHIVVDGVDVDGVQRPPNATVNKFAVFRHASHVVLRGGKFRNANGWQGIGVNDSSYVTIEDNDLDWVGQYYDPNHESIDVGDSIELRGGNVHHVLVQRNVLRHGGHDLLRVGGTNCVIQDNYLNNSFRDVLGGDKGARAGDLGGNNNLFQRNFVTGSGVSSDAPSNALQKIQGTNNIVRHNLLVAGFQEAFMTETGSWTGSTPSTYARIYNNTFYNLGGPAWRMRYYGGGAAIGDAVFVNNLIVDTRLNPSSSGSSDSDLMFIVSGAKRGPTAQSVVRGNIFSPGLRKSARVYLEAGGGLVDLPAAERQFPGLFASNRSASATFVKAAPETDRDFNLAPGSAGVDQGTFLTTVSRSGRSDQIAVADARYFSNGFGLIAGDMIQLQGSQQRVRVTSIDYATNTLRVSEALELSAGQGVALAYQGKAPEVGAKELAAGPQPPKAVHVEGP